MFHCRKYTIGYTNVFECGKAKMILIRSLVRFAALLSFGAIISGYAKWPDSMFVSSCVMLLIWAHAEWDWLRQQ